MREQSTQRLLKLISLVTFLFSDKKVTHRLHGKDTFMVLMGIMFPGIGYNDSKSPTMVPGAPVKADRTSTAIP